MISLEEEDEEEESCMRVRWTGLRKLAQRSGWSLGGIEASNASAVAGNETTSGSNLWQVRMRTINNLNVNLLINDTNYFSEMCFMISQ